MKKRLLLVMMLIGIVALLIHSTLTLNANKALSDSKNASYEMTETTKSFTTDYTSYKTDLGTTTYNGNTYKQRVHVFFQKQTKNSKIVTWAVQSDAGKLSRVPVSAICANYELLHPGWKVVGAINADQYTTGFGDNIGAKGKDYYYPQPYYSMIADGEGWFTMTGLPAMAQNILGFLQDGSENPLISGSSNIINGNIKFSGMYLYILDNNGNRLEKFQVNKFNESPRELETAVWSSHYNEKEEFPDMTISSSNNIYVVKRAERAIANNSIDYQYKDKNGYDAFFGKGIISEVTSKATFGYGAFAVETNDEYLRSKLAKGTRIIVQYELEGKFANVESAIGYHTIHRMNGVDIPSSGSYNTSKYTRSIVGRSSDGKIFLMAVDQTNYSGMNWEEIDACLKYYDVDEAYQMDGGGSTTAVIKENDKFVVVNTPRDGAPRSILNALLLVEKDETVETKIQKMINRKNIYVKRVKKEDE